MLATFPQCIFDWNFQRYSLKSCLGAFLLSLSECSTLTCPLYITKKNIKGFICLIWFAIYHSQNFCIKITICLEINKEKTAIAIGMCVVCVSSLDADLPAKIFRCCCVSTPSNHPMFICMCISNSSTEHFQCCWSGTATKTANQQPT